MFIFTNDSKIQVTTALIIMSLILKSDGFLNG